MSSLHKLRRRKRVIKDVRRIYRHYDFFAALHYGGKVPCAGDVVLLCIVVQTLGALHGGGRIGLLQLGALLAAAEVERKTGFVLFNSFKGLYPGADPINLFKALERKGFFMPAAYPETFGHVIAHKSKCHILSDKGRQCVADYYRLMDEAQKKARAGRLADAEGIA